MLKRLCEEMGSRLVKIEDKNSCLRRVVCVPGYGPDLSSCAVIRNGPSIDVILGMIIPKMPTKVTRFTYKKDSSQLLGSKRHDRSATI